MATASKTAPEQQQSDVWYALAAFQADLPHVGKGSVNPAFKSKYADLADIVKVVLPALARLGCAWTTVPSLSEDGFVLNYELRHAASGTAITGVWPLPDPVVTGVQQLGSAISYGKRYALSAVVGIAPDEDDDGNAAQQAPATSRKKSPPPAAPEPPAIASEGWAALILDVNSIDELRVVHVRVEEEGELGMQFAAGDARAVGEVVKHFGLDAPPATVSVGQMIGAVRKAIESRPELEAPSEDTPAVLTDDWEVAAIPDGERES